MEGSPSFTALLRKVQGVTVLRVSGELDLHSAPRFQDALERAVSAAEQAEGPAPKVLVVDLSAAKFIDSAGIGTLMGSTQGFRDSGGGGKAGGFGRGSAAPLGGHRARRGAAGLPRCAIGRRRPVKWRVTRTYG